MLDIKKCTPFYSEKSKFNEQTHFLKGVKVKMSQVCGKRSMS